VASLSKKRSGKTLVNSMIWKEKGIKRLAGFGFDNTRISRNSFYKYMLNFPKFFLNEIVEN